MEAISTDKTSKNPLPLKELNRGRQLISYENYYSNNLENTLGCKIWKVLSVE